MESNRSEQERAAPPLRIAPRSRHWPRELDRVEGAPEALWLRGRIELLARRPRVAIVGSRSPSMYGLEQAARFADGLARADIVVVSGLARGVDQAAHEAALAAGGATIAVLGCGVDRPWPSGPLARRMAEEGLLLSEFRPGTGPRRHHFPLRNRLISALGRGVLVVEGAQRSGSLITARWALAQGRDVFALPGRVDQPMARGTHRLIRDGATPVESPEELLDDLFGLDPHETEREGRAPASSPSSSAPSSPLLEALRGETLGADEIAARLGLSVGPVLAELARHELEGRLRRGPGGLYSLRAGSARGP